MASKSIIPAVIHWTRSLADSVNAVRQAGAEPDVQCAMLTESNDLLLRTKRALEELSDLTEKAELKPEGRERAVFYHEQILPAMEALRAPVDRLEMIVDKDMWPMPSYGDLLFEI
jgi:glutamine synthetase